MDRLKEIEARKLEIREEVEATEDVEKIEELEAEVDALNEEVEEIDVETEEVFITHAGVEEAVINDVYEKVKSLNIFIISSSYKA